MQARNHQLSSAGRPETRRWLYGVLIVTSALGLAVVLCVLRYYYAPPPLTEEVAGRIEVGMTKKQVEYVLGRPEGDYTTGPCFFIPSGSQYSDRHWCHWLDDHGEIEVKFDDGNKVKKVVHLPVVRLREETAFERVKRFVSGLGPFGATIPGSRKGSEEEDGQEKE
jgi:hypothetical protein